MCFHNSMSADAMSLKKRFSAELVEPENFQPIFHENAFRHRPRPVITGDNPKLIQNFVWGLIPSWTKTEVSAKEIQEYTPNARSETVFEKPSFRGVIRSRRCLVPSTGFFEWQDFKGKKYPYFIFLKDQEIFSLAGIWDSWKNPVSGEIVNSFSILTTDANPLMARIHNSKKRMPLILPKEGEEAWIDPELKEEKDIRALFKIFPEEKMDAYTISKLITSRNENSNVREVSKEFIFSELSQENLF
ncbi:SOS response-associated peptidase [Leptospira sp. 201903071]|uniref:SOS response-associated peptidase n=1 Tax=Leptospira ainazelensis TaxID=2810034 RepID=UPI00196307B6|nr:SOS response-associated peptidase [Leptospira ainazelensis]MBM9499693.1 SOS response-associated peptidase [Leptospira ainazelensis]